MNQNLAKPIEYRISEKKAYIPDMATGDLSVRISRPSRPRIKTQNQIISQIQNTSNDLNNEIGKISNNFGNVSMVDLVRFVQEINDDYLPNGLSVYYKAYTVPSAKYDLYPDKSSQFTGGFRVYAQQTGKTYPISVLTKTKFYLRVAGDTLAQAKERYFVRLKDQAKESGDASYNLQLFRIMKAINRFSSSLNGILRKTSKSYDFNKIIQQRKDNRINSKVNSKLRKLARRAGWGSVYDYVKNTDKSKLAQDLRNYEEYVVNKLQEQAAERASKMKTANRDLATVFDGINRNNTKEYISETKRRYGTGIQQDYQVQPVYQRNPIEQQLENQIQEEAEQVVEEIKEMPVVQKTIAIKRTGKPKTQEIMTLVYQLANQIPGGNGKNMILDAYKAIYNAPGASKKEVMTWWTDKSLPADRVEIISKIADDAGTNALDVLRKMMMVREGGQIANLGKF